MVLLSCLIKLLINSLKKQYKYRMEFFLEYCFLFIIIIQICIIVIIVYYI